MTFEDPVQQNENEAGEESEAEMIERVNRRAATQRRSELFSLVARVALGVGIVGGGGTATWQALGSERPAETATRVALEEPAEPRRIDTDVAPPAQTKATAEAGEPAKPARHSPELWPQRLYLEKVVGPDEVRWLMEASTIKDEAERQEKLDQLASLEILEMGRFAEYVSEDDLRLLYTECLPHGAGAKTVTYEDRLIPLPKRYTMDTAGTEQRYAAGNAYGRIGKILFSEGTRRLEQPHAFIRVFLHEVAHCMDPSTHPYLMLEERMDMYAELVGRVSAPDRFHSSYVESINNPDAQVEVRSKAKEYFAVVFAQYICDDALLPRADRAMIARLIATTDPEFDLENARKIYRLLGNKLRLEKEGQTDQAADVEEKINRLIEYGDGPH